MMMEATPGRFVPPVPKTMEETGLSSVLIEELVFKIMLSKGAMTGREVANDLCLHFPLVAEELKAAAPRPLAFVDGNEGIARRTAWLMLGESWPDAPGEGVAVFTGDGEIESCRAGLARYGLTRIERL